VTKSRVQSNPKSTQPKILLSQHKKYSYLLVSFFCRGWKCNELIERAGQVGDDEDDVWDGIQIYSFMCTFKLESVGAYSMSSLAIKPVTSQTATLCWSTTTQWYSNGAQFVFKC